MLPRRPRTPQLGAPNGPGATQEAPKMRQESPKNCPRGVQEATHRRLGAKTRHKAAPDSLQTSIFNHFGHDLEGFWDHFGWIFGMIFNQLGIHTLETIRWRCWGGCAPPHTHQLRGAHLEERTVAGTPLCGARDKYAGDRAPWAPRAYGPQGPMSPKGPWIHKGPMGPHGSHGPQVHSTKIP